MLRRLCRNGGRQLRCNCNCNCDCN